MREQTIETMLQIPFAGLCDSTRDPAPPLAHITRKRTSCDFA